MAYYYSNQQHPYHYHPNQSYYQTNLNHDYYHTQYYNTNHLYTSHDYYYYHYNTINPTRSTTNIFDDHASSQIATFHAVNNAKDDDNDDDDDIDMEEDHKKNFHGGYNMSETYGKPLPPSDEICYPPGKVEASNDIGHFSYDSVASPYGKDGQNHAQNEAKRVNEVAASQPIEEAKAEEEDTSEDDDDGDGDGDGDGGGGGDGGGDEKEVVVRRQIPPGYGIEAVDLCEGVFGGYFPCLWKRRDIEVRNSNEISYYNDDGDQYNYWKGTADYLFGNPNPYGGSMVEKGSYGDPVYCYHRYSPQQSIWGQAECEKSGW